MGKQTVRDFDPDVCMGRRNDVSEPCPKLKDIDESTGRPVVDLLARAEGIGLSIMGDGGDLGPEDLKCGACGCPLPNLELFDQAPDRCPRLEQHNTPR